MSKPNTGSILLVISFVLIMITGFMGKTEYFFYAFAFAFFMIACGIIKENKTAFFSFLLLSMVILFINYFHYHPNEIITEEILQTIAVPLIIVSTLIYTGTAFMWHFFIKKYIKKKRMKKVQGFVKKLDSHEGFVKRNNHYKVRTYYKEIFCYNINGTEYTKEAVTWKTSSYFKKGESVNIYYNPDNPEEVILPIKYDMLLFIIFIILLCFINAVVFLIAWLKGKNII